jgi:hypothetical protein
MSVADLPSLKTRNLGRTNVRVTELGLGTAPPGELFDKVEDDEAAAIIGAAWDGGGHYFDTSPWYGRGLAEHSLGRALHRKPRDHYVISTKIGRVLRRPLGPNAIKDQWLGALEFQTVFDYGYDGVMRSFEDSLQRLGINRVDVLLIHDLDPWDHNQATLNAYFTQLKTSGWRALAELREAGVIRGIGAGFNSMGSIQRFLDLFDMDFSSWRCATRCSSRMCSTASFRAARSGASGSSLAAATFRDSCDRRRSRRDVQLCPGRPRDPGAGEKDRGGLRVPSCSASRRGAALPARTSHRRLDHSGRDFPRPGEADRISLPPSDPPRPVGRTETRQIDSL